MASNPKGSKPGVTGFVQEYNQEPGPRQDLNPDVVDNPESLPAPLATPRTARAATARPARTPRKGRK